MLMAVVCLSVCLSRDGRSGTRRKGRGGKFTRFKLTNLNRLAAVCLFYTHGRCITRRNLHRAVNRARRSVPMSEKPNTISRFRAARPTIMTARSPIWNGVWQTRRDDIRPRNLSNKPFYGKLFSTADVPELDGFDYRGFDGPTYLCSVSKREIRSLVKSKQIPSNRMFLLADNNVWRRKIGDVPFLWGKGGIVTPVKSKPWNIFSKNLLQLITSI